jgi:predicted ATPase
VDLELTLANFNCFIGLNGSGKSTILQVFDFISQLMIGDIDGWLDSRGWETGDLKSNFAGKQDKFIKFIVKYRSQDGRLLKWTAYFSKYTKRCSKWESIEYESQVKERPLLRVTGGFVTLNGKKEKISFEYQGSILSQLRESDINKMPDLAEFRQFIINIKSLDLLSPHMLKNNSRGKADIGLGGERFPSLLRNLEAKHQDLREKIAEFYPVFYDYHVKTLRGGTKKLEITEDCGKQGNVIYKAQHLNDGTLRLMAILAQLYLERSILLLDEIENGINSELFDKLIRVLLDSDKQVIVTTHSPMILNYLSREEATESVIFLYKKDGVTKAKRFFELPEISYKLDFLGPGEAYVDTNLDELSKNLRENNE